MVSRERQKETKVQFYCISLHFAHSQAWQVIKNIHTLIRVFYVHTRLWKIITFPAKFIRCKSNAVRLEKWMRIPFNCSVAMNRYFEFVLHFKRIINASNNHIDKISKFKYGCKCAVNDAVSVNLVKQKKNQNSIQSWITFIREHSHEKQSAIWLRYENLITDIDWVTVSIVHMPKLSVCFGFIFKRTVGKSPRYEFKEGKKRAASFDIAKWSSNCRVKVNSIQLYFDIFPSNCWFLKFFGLVFWWIYRKFVCQKADEKWREENLVNLKRIETNLHSTWMHLIYYLWMHETLNDDNEKNV